MYFYCFELNGETVGYVYGDLESCYWNQEKDEKINKRILGLFMKMFRNMGFESIKEYFVALGANKPVLTRDPTLTIIYYESKPSKTNPMPFRARITSDSFDEVNSLGSWYSFTRIDEEVARTIKAGCPCMFLLQPSSVYECAEEIGITSGICDTGYKTVPPDAIWFCEDFENGLEKRKLDLWYNDQIHGNCALRGKKHPTWRTNEEVLRHHESFWDELIDNVFLIISKLLS